jgi:hypothetical protein
MKFTYRSKGTADEWTEESVEADSREEAQNKLDEIYGITRDEQGNQTNANVVQVELIG